MLTCLLQLLPGRARKLYLRMQVRPLISGGGAVISRTGPLSTLDTTVSTALVAASLLRGGELTVALQHFLQRLWPPCFQHRGFLDTALRGVRHGLTKGVTLRQPCLRPEGSKSLTAYDGPRACAP